MKNDLDSKLILRVFEKIQRNGDKQGDHYFLHGIKGSTDYEGYTLYLEDALVNLSFGFHNQYHFEYQQEQHLEQFIKKLQYIDNTC